MAQTEPCPVQSGEDYGNDANPRMQEEGGYILPERVLLSGGSKIVFKNLLKTTSWFFGSKLLLFFFKNSLFINTTTKKIQTENKTKNKFETYKARVGNPSNSPVLSYPGSAAVAR